MAASVESEDDPSLVPVERTLAFVGGVLPPPPARVLEVGCGRGALAARLIAAGYRLSALDADAEAVAEARSRGVPAVHQDFLDYQDQPFAAVLCIRVLHHLSPLELAVGKLATLLEINGILVIEDFAHERMDAETAAWLDTAERKLEAAGLLRPEEDPESGQERPAGPLERWRWYYRVLHKVHPGATVRAAVAARLRLVEEADGPYLHRYACHRLIPGAPSVRAARDLLESEIHEIDRGAIRPIGVRLVARRV